MLKKLLSKIFGSNNSKIENPKVETISLDGKEEHLPQSIDPKEINEDKKVDDLQKLQGRFGPNATGLEPNPQDQATSPKKGLSKDMPNPFRDTTKQSQ
jgi:hypothetical protein